MAALVEQLERWSRGRVCLLGMGNVDLSDDGAGVRLAETLAARLGQVRPAARGPRVVEAGTAPERFLGQVAAEGFDDVVFLDAVDFGGEPGAVIVADAGQMAARFPQISTHKIALGLLAKWVENAGGTRAWLLGVQPQSLKPGAVLTPVVKKSVDVLAGLLCRAWKTEASA